MRHLSAPVAILNAAKEASLRPHFAFELVQNPMFTALRNFRDIDKCSSANDKRMFVLTRFVIQYKRSSGRLGDAG